MPLYRRLFSAISIKWKIFGYLLCFCGLLLAVLWTFQIVLLEQVYRHIKIREIYSAAQVMETQMGNDDFGAVLNSLSKEEMLCAEIVGSDGTVLFSAQGIPDGVLHRLSLWDRLAIMEITREQGGEMFRYIRDAGPMLMLESPFPQSGDEDTVLTLREDAAGMDGVQEGTPQRFAEVPGRTPPREAVAVLRDKERAVQENTEEQSQSGRTPTDSQLVPHEADLAPESSVFASGETGPASGWDISSSGETGAVSAPGALPSEEMGESGVVGGGKRAPDGSLPAPLGQSDMPRFSFFDRGQEKSIILSRLTMTQEGEERLLMVNAIVTPVSATVETLQVQLMWVTVIMLVFSVVLALVISRNVSAPMEAISRKARILAGGDFDVEFGQSGYREVREMSDTLTQMAKELSRVETLRRELVANISHDLRTPLTLIEGYAEAMRDLPGENNAENAQIILDETKRLTTLVADTLDLSKLQGGAVELRFAPVEVGEMVTGLVHPLREMLKNKGYRIDWETPPEPIWVCADKTRLTQAVYNLLINAVNYTGEDKRVWVSWELTEQGELTLSVNDTGEGVSQKDLPYIWDRYYKSGKNHKRGVTGTGLGLSIVKSIFQQHGCQYGVDSIPGQGSRFWLRLPTIHLEQPS